MRRLCTLACLTLVWLLATATPASAHCHRSITYGPSSGIGDCGEAAFWGTLALAAAVAIIHTVALLRAFYFLNQAKIKYFGRGLRIFNKGLSGRSADHDKAAENAEVVARLLPPEVGIPLELAVRLNHISGMRVGYRMLDGVRRWFGDWADRMGKSEGGRVITDVLCGRASEPPADSGRAGALAAIVAGELAHRIFLDAADVRIVEFVRQLHQQTGADPHLLDAVLRGLLGQSLPAVTDPLTPLIVLGRGLVLALGLGEQAVAELVTRAEQQLPERLPSAAASPTPQPPTGAAPAVLPTPTPSKPVPPNPVPPNPEPSTSGRPRLTKTPYLVGGALAGLGVLVLSTGAVLLLGVDRNEQPPPPSATTAPPESDPGYVTNAFAQAINTAQSDRALELLCSGSSSMTRHIAEGRLRVQEFTVNRVETRNSTTAYVLAKAIIPPQPDPLVWRGTLHNRGGKWCVLDIHPEDDSPPAQPETRDVAFEKMRDFITLVNKKDSVKAMTYACGTPQRRATQTMIDVAIKSGARLEVKPKPGPEGASSYTGSLTGRSKFGHTIDGRVTTSKADSGTYCVSYFEIRLE